MPNPCIYAPGCVCQGDCAYDREVATQQEREAKVRPDPKALLRQPLMDLQSDIIRVTDGREHEAVNAAFAKMHRKVAKLLSPAQPRLL